MANAVSATTGMPAVSRCAAQLGQRLHAVHVGQLYVHQDKPGPVSARQRDAVLGVRRLQRPIARVN